MRSGISILSLLQRYLYTIYTQHGGLWSFPAACNETINSTHWYSKKSQWYIFISPILAHSDSGALVIWLENCFNYNYLLYESSTFWANEKRVIFEKVVLQKGTTEIESDECRYNEIDNQNENRRVIPLHAAACMKFQREHWLEAKS